MNYFAINKYDPDEIIEYLRKSRADDPLSTVEEVLAKHEQILNEWVEKNLEAPIPAENIYKEVVSGETIEGRPEVQKVLNRIESPKIKAILVVEPQRLSRGDLEDCGRLIKLLRYTNTKVITPMKTYDLSDDYDRDAFERELKRGNEYLEYFKKIQSRGRLVSVQEGNYIGSIPPYGYDKSIIQEGRKKYPTLKINEKEAEIVRMIFDLYVNEGMGLVNICKKLDAMNIKPRNGKNWSYPSLLIMIENVHYIGKIKWNCRKQVYVVKDQELSSTRPRQKDYLIFDGKHEPIISEEIFYKAQELRKKSARTAFDKELKNPFAGLLFCSCGRAMRLRSYKQASGHYSMPRFQCFNQATCNSGSVLADELIEIVREALKNQIKDFEISMSNNDEEALKRKETTIILLEKKLKELELKELSLWDKYTEEAMPKTIFEQLKEKLENDKREVSRSLEEEQNNIISVVNYNEKITSFSKALDALDDDELSATEKNNLLKDCIDFMTYSRERPKRVVGVGNVNGWQAPPVKLNIKMKI